MPGIHTLVEDIQRVLRTDVPSRPLETDEWAHAALRLAKSITPRTPTPGYVRDPYVLWPREIGEKCLRKVWYNLHPDPKAPVAAANAADAMKFKYGHLLEETLLTYAELAGHTVEHRQRKLTEEMFSFEGDHWKIRGKIDAVIDGVLVDVKSCSKTVFNDLTSYYPQVSWYATIGGWKDAGILAVEKSSGRIRYEVVPTYVPVGQTYDPVTLDELAATAPPPRPWVSAEKLPDGCMWCPHKYRCWPGLQAYRYAFGPEFYVEPPDRVIRVPLMSQEEVENEPIRG